MATLNSKRRLLTALIAVGISHATKDVFAEGTVQMDKPVDPVSSGILVHSGQKVCFLGASISEFGWNQPAGYLKLFVACLAANGIEIIPLPAGVSGNTSRDMLARLEHDVIERKPDWVTIDAGGNDVWHGSVPFDEYMANMTAIVDKAQAAHIRVVLQTCTPLFEEIDGDFNRKLAYYNDFLRYLAGQKQCVLADLNADALKTLKSKTGTDNILTVDGVHMNDRGNRVMAIGLLKAFGLTEEKIARTIPLS